uniref:Ig-like domain-containing protein n=1 Tax=Sphenodon punctatus TaxID=8508 RepID=A0A8D0GI24_SPHPU
GTAKLLWAHRVSYLLSTWSCPLWLESWVGNGAGGRQRRLPSTSTPALRPRTLRQAAASWHLEDNPASALRAPSRQPGTGNWHGLAGLVIVHPELKARVGDSVPLKCSFLSSEPQGWAVWRVDWIYRPQNATQPGGAAGRFQSRVRWLGNVSCGDGAVELRDVRGNDSGTYTCEIRLWSHSAVYKNRTLLRVDPAEGRRASGSDSPSAESPSKASSWGVVGYIGTAIFLGISLGLILRKTVWRLSAPLLPASPCRRATSTSVWRGRRSQRSGRGAGKKVMRTREPRGDWTPALACVGGSQSRARLEIYPPRNSLSLPPVNHCTRDRSALAPSTVPPGSCRAPTAEHAGLLEIGYCFLEEKLVP